MNYVKPYELSGSESRIYDLVARHFVATVSPDAIYLRTKVQFKGAEEMFHLSARVLIDPGFLEIQRRPRRTEANDGGGGGGDGVEEEKKLRWKLLR